MDKVRQVAFFTPVLTSFVNLFVNLRIAPFKKVPGLEIILSSFVLHGRYEIRRNKNRNFRGEINDVISTTQWVPIYSLSFRAFARWCAFVVKKIQVLPHWFSIPLDICTKKCRALKIFLDTGDENLPSHFLSSFISKIANLAQKDSAINSTIKYLSHQDLRD